MHSGTSGNSAKVLRFHRGKQDSGGLPAQVCEEEPPPKGPSSTHGAEAAEAEAEVQAEAESGAGSDEDMERAASTFSKHEEMAKIRSRIVRKTFHELRTRSTLTLKVPYAHQMCVHIRRMRSTIKRHVSAHWFEVLMTFFIITNSCFCGVEVEYMARSRRDTPPSAFHWINLSYTVIFALELLLRLVAEGQKFLLGENYKWNFFDGCIVFVSLAEAVIDRSADSNRSVSSLRVLRMARVVRVLRIARIMRRFRALRILIYSVMGTLRSLFWTMVMLGVLLYMSGIIFTQAVTMHALTPGSWAIPGLEECYGTLGNSVFTLFKAISGGTDWEDAMAPLQRLHPIWVAFFLVYFSFTYFAVLNVVTGVFCQTAIEGAKFDHEMALQMQMSAKQKYIREFQNLFKHICHNNWGKITLQEFETSMQDEKVCAYFASLDLSIDEAFSLFKLLDTDHVHCLDVDTFVTGCLRLRGQAKTLDIAMMMYETRWCMQRCMKVMKRIEAMTESTETSVEAVCHQFTPMKSFSGQLDPFSIGLEPVGKNHVVDHRI